MAAWVIFSLLLVSSWNLYEGAAVGPTTPPPGCLYQGIMYPAGSTIPTGPCMPCTCPESGGRPMCLAIDCLMPSCVNPVRETNQCCSKCPDGPNCYMGNKIIPAGKDVIDGDRTCRCPEMHFGLGFGVSTQQAHCTHHVIQN